MVDRAQTLALGHAENVVFAQNQVLIAFDLDFTAGIFAEQDTVPSLHIGRQQLAIFRRFALAHRNYDSLLGLFLGGIGDDNPALGLFFFLDPLYQNPVSQWPN